MAEIALALLGPLTELGKCLFPPIKRQVNYLCCHNKIVKSFEGEEKELATAKTDLDQKVDDEEIKGNDIATGVTNWLTKYSEMEEMVKGIKNENSNVQSGCLAIKSRYVLNKKIHKVIGDMKDLRDRCNKLNAIGKSPQPPSIVPAPLREANEFCTRKQIEEDVMQALREKNVGMMGICGMGGLGKTTMARKVMHRVRDENLFEEVLMVVVSKDIDELKIQQQLAELLGLSLDVQTLGARAHKLRKRLISNKRSLIVVDDIWSAFDLADLGIPCESGGTSNCTILLTSRSQNVLKEMKAVMFTMEVLDKAEAWALFKSEVGDFVEEKNFESIAKKVVEECNGLPLALAILGSSLKDQKETSIWKDTLYQLQHSYLKKIPGVDEKVYPSLKLSYDKLNNSDASRLFLLCSQFPEDSNISLNDLAMYCMSLRLFGRSISNMEKTRHRLSTVVDQLKKLSLLLDGMIENSVKMHDVVRDVANVIAREEGLVDADEGSSSAVKCQWMFMFPNTCDELRDHLAGSNYPSLCLLAIQRKNRWGASLIIESLPSMDKMKELCSLSLDHTSIKSFPQAIQTMKNLHMLYFVGCELECISIVGELLLLEVLVCRDCRNIKELPVEIRGLTNLKLLEFDGCQDLKKIVPGVISKLTKLEKFIMWDSFKGWELAKGKVEERSNASVQELESLTQLKLLWIHIKDVGVVEQKLCLPQNIDKYKILVGEVGFARGRWICHSEKSLSLYGLPKHMIIHQDWIQKLVSTMQDLYFNGKGSRNFDVAQHGSNIMSLQIEYNEMVEALTHNNMVVTSDGVFPLVKSLKLKKLPNLNKIYGGSVSERLISFNNLEKLDLESLPMLTSLWKIPNQNASSLNNLCTIRIWYCNKLKNLFPMSAFLQVKVLEIYYCEMMEKVFYNDENENEGTSSYHNIFPKLEELTLSSLPSLTTFAKGIESIKFPLLRQLQILNCPKLIFNDQKVAFGSLKGLQISGHLFSKIWCSQISYDSFGQLEELTITDYESIIFSSSYSPSMPHFVNLKRLSISGCTEMEKVFADEVPSLTSPFLYGTNAKTVP